MNVNPMNMRQTSMWVGIIGVILLVSNTEYFSHGFHRPFTWLIICLDLLCIVLAVIMFVTAERRTLPPPRN